MTYTAVADFKYGMDRRRPQVSGVPGTLYLLKNALVTRGGDIERAKKFVATDTLPAGTFGLYSIRGQRYVFGSTVGLGASIPVGVRYIRLDAPGAPAMTRIFDVRGFDGKLYVIAGYADGNIYHFYDNDRVTDWDELADSAADFTTVAARLADLIDAQSSFQAKAYGNVVEITAVAPGTGFTVVSTTTDNSPTTTPTALDEVVQANVAAVAEVRATGTIEVTGGTQSLGVNRITSVTIDGDELLSATVDWIDSDTATANALAVEINNMSSSHGYVASPAGAIVTLTAAVGTGDTPNGAVVAGSTSGDVTVATTDVDGGVTEIEPVAQVSKVTIGASDKAIGTVTITGGTSSPGTNKISALTVAGEALISAAVDWVTSHPATATALASAINSGTGTHGFTAGAVGAVVTITSAEADGKLLSAAPVVVTVGGTVTATKTDMVWTSYSSDLWKITLDGADYQTTGRASATGVALHINKSRVYSLAGSLIRFSKINDALDWTDTDAASGAGFINVGNEVEGAENLIGMAKYSNLTAVFSRNSIVTYSLTADAENAEIVQPIDNTGTLAARSLVAYGAQDVYYLDETGIRSLKTRDTFNAAYASDVGSAIDPFVQEIIASLDSDTVSRASAVIEASDGRYMLALGSKIIVLSSFPSSKITAWSYIDFGQTISDLVRVGRSVYLRSGDVIYQYGGPTGAEYPDADEFEILAETPFISSKDPAGEKLLQGFDMAAVNTWRVQILVNPNDPAKFVDAGHIYGTTYALDAIKLVGSTSHFALRMTCRAAGFASLSSVAVHHSAGEKA